MIIDDIRELKKFVQGSSNDDIICLQNIDDNLCIWSLSHNHVTCRVLKLKKTDEIVNPERFDSAIELDTVELKKAFKDIKVSDSLTINFGDNNIILTQCFNQYKVTTNSNSNHLRPPVFEYDIYNSLMFTADDLEIFKGLTKYVCRMNATVDKVMLEVYTRSKEPVCDIMMYNESLTNSEVTTSICFSPKELLTVMKKTDMKNKVAQVIYSEMKPLKIINGNYTALIAPRIEH